ncbi:hypothetical protein X801_04737 [Opisthorchis viverrini]|uniref:Ion transport domain-containing protein n=1 Tax=Opisthorchis viverrini TaxID=6198 RepID=A0A1S8WY74_OPIVI|nr:hypothetical protein X801_04737 [Opisthorchis viverrini]
MSFQNLVSRSSIASQAREEDEIYLSTRAQRFLFSSSLVRDACVSRLEIKYKRDLVSLKLYENFHSKLMTGIAAESYLLLFTLAVGNNWHHLADGLQLTVSSWVRVYFIVIHWSCVILVLNVILAFIIEAFLLEFDTRQTHFEAYVRQRLVELEMDANIELEKRGIYGYGTPGFHITREQLDHAFPHNAPVTKAFLALEDHASIEVLMFRMFEREIEQLIRDLRSDAKNAKQYKTRDIYSQFN